MSLALIEPEIPGNVGSIGRTCVALDSQLQIVAPIPFEITDARVKRAGLDYWPHLDWIFFQNQTEFFAKNQGRRIVLTSARMGIPYHEFQFLPQDVIVMGKETMGLGELLKKEFPVVHLPMWGKTRSINVANAATVFLYEAWRQIGFPKGL